MQQVVNGGNMMGVVGTQVALRDIAMCRFEANLLFGYHSCPQYFSGALASSASPCGDVGRRFTSLERYTRGV